MNHGVDVWQVHPQQLERINWKQMRWPRRIKVRYSAHLRIVVCLDVVNGPGNDFQIVVVFTDDQLLFVNRLHTIRHCAAGLLFALKTHQPSWYISFVEFFGSNQWATRAAITMIVIAVVVALASG